MTLHNQLNSKASNAGCNVWTNPNNLPALVPMKSNWWYWANAKTTTKLTVSFDFCIILCNFKCFPSDNFTYFLTLFPKFFSSFPHGTCMLLISCKYLALDGIYHPLWIAIPNYPTLWKYVKLLVTHWINGLSPFRASNSREFIQQGPIDIVSINYNSHSKTVRFQNWALPVSLAVTQGILVSFFSSAY